LGTTLVSLPTGRIDLYPDGTVYADLRDLTANPLVLDRDLLQALPPAVKKTCESLQLQNQAVGVQTRLVILVKGEPGSPPDVFWDGKVWLKDAKVNAGLDLNK